MSSPAQGTEAEVTAEVPATTGAPLVTPRGETLIAPQVVEKIATRAASEVAGVGGVVQGGLARLLPWVTGDSSAEASADVYRDTVAVDLTVNVRYPEPVRKVTTEVRDHVTRRLAELTGLTATEVNIRVDELVLQRGAARRRVE